MDNRGESFFLSIENADERRLGGHRGEPLCQLNCAGKAFLSMSLPLQADFASLLLRAGSGSRGQRLFQMLPVVKWGKRK